MRPHAPAFLLLTTLPLSAFAQSTAPVTEVPIPSPTASPAPDATAANGAIATASTPVTPVPPPPPPPPPAAPQAQQPAQHPAHAAQPGPWPPLASWHNDVFYISSPDQNWFIAPTGRLQFDGYVYTPPAVTHDYTTSAGAYRRPDVMNTIMLRRARIELVGGFLRRFTFMLGAEFNSAAPPIATDLIVNARAFPILNLQLGQFDAPFTMENRTSDKYIDFLERSIAVRALGIPTNKEIGLMLWGEMPNRTFYYALGVFNGDGQNRLNRDNYFDAMGRVFAHPFIVAGGPLANLQIGASFRVGWRGPSVDYQYPNMTTQGGWTFFNSAIAGGTNPLTIVPESLQAGVAGEVDVPIGRFDVRGEFIWVRNGTAEMAAAASDAARLAGPAQRLGILDGIGGYLQLGCWVYGDTEVNGRPGYQNPPALNLDRADRNTPPFGVQVVARFDAVNSHYQGAARSDPDRSAAPDGLYAAYAAELGVNLWWTRHVRFSLNYMEYFFPGEHNGSGSTAYEENHSRGPNGSAHFNGTDTFGELSARVGLVL